MSAILERSLSRRALLAALAAAGVGAAVSGSALASESGKEADAAADAAKDASAEQAADSQSVVDELYAEFDKSMSEQLGEDPTPAGEKIGCVIISLTNQFWANMKDCYEEAGEKLGIDVDVQTGTTEGDTQSQLDVLNTMADMGYDAIIVSPIDGTNLIPGIVKCNENGVKVINLGPGVDTEALEEAGGHLDGKITVRFQDQGRMVAEDMVARLGDGGGEVAILQGLTGAGQSEGRTAGATEVFEADDKIDLVASVPCDWDATTAYDSTKDILSEHPDLAGIFACNDVMALAAVEALEAEDKQGVLVYGVDFTDDAREAIKEGRMTGTMSYSSAKYTEAALKLAVAICQGREYADPIYLPLTLVTVDNVNDLDDWR